MSQKKISEFQVRKLQVEIIEGDITNLPSGLQVDAIVTDNNGALLIQHVNSALNKAAGPELLKACMACQEKMPGMRCQCQ